MTSMKQNIVHIENILKCKRHFFGFDKPMSVIKFPQLPSTLIKKKFITKKLLLSVINNHNHNIRVIFSHELKLDESFIKVAGGVDLTF